MTNRAASLHVLMIPHYGDGNPYLRLLSSALEDRQVRVSLGRVWGWVPLWAAVRRSGRPDLVHLHWQHRFFVPKHGGWIRTWAATALFFAQFLSLRATGTRFVWTVHNITNHEGHRERWELAASKLLARLVDRLIVHCHAVLPTVAAAYRVPPERIDVCPHGTYGDWYRGPATRADARDALGLPTESRILLYFGLIRPYKGVDRLIRTFREIEGAALRLVVLGMPKAPGLESTIRELACRDPRVEAHLEFVEDDRLAAYLKACDAVVLPYRDSLTSGAAVLAGAAHRPVVMPKLGCAREYPDGSGYFYDPGDPEGLRNALERACREDTDVRGEAAARYVAQFTWDNVAGTLSSIYGAVLDRAVP